ncbi:HNH endonuclease family protein, partial [Alistipes finegoldii]
QIANYLENRDYSPIEYTIEHVIDEAEGNSNNIGNLIVLERILNDKINDIKQKQKSISFNDKLSIYNESVYKMTKDFVTTHSQFARDEIESRS